MARIYLTALACAGAFVLTGFFLLSPPPREAHGEQVVIDPTAISKLTEQLNKMQQQIDAMTEQTEWLSKMSVQVQAQVDAVGKAGQIRLPTLNMEKLKRRIRADAQCLKPDFPRVGIETEEAEIASVCQGRALYRNQLWFDREALEEDAEYQGMTSREQSQFRNETSSKVKKRRTFMSSEASLNGFAMADLIFSKSVEENETAIVDLERAGASAKSTQERLAVLAQAQILGARQNAQIIQLLAQLLKVESALLMGLSVPVAAPSRE